MISKDNPPQQQALLPTCSFGFGHEIRHLQHQNLGHQVGNFFLPQPPNHNEVLIASSLPNSSSHLYEPTCNQAKKDRRNTKIKTANGVRDRRVRLSMGIAREFFDLQDMLGFDRASNTLGWLLAKSKGAIQELVLEKQRLDQFQGGSFSFGATDDLVSASAADALESASASHNYNDKIEKGNVGVSQASVVRENRVKARARARARTREKMSSTMPKPVRFDHHVLKAIEKGDSANSIAADSKTRLHYDGMNVMMNQDSPRLVSCTSYLQHHPIAPGSNPESTILSISGWNIFDQFPNW